MWQIDGEKEACGTKGGLVSKRKQSMKLVVITNGKKSAEVIVRRFLQVRWSEYLRKNQKLKLILRDLHRKGKSMSLTFSLIFRKSWRRTKANIMFALQRTLIPNRSPRQFFLKQHDIRSYDALAKKVENAVSHFNSLSSSIKEKEKEKRLAEIQVLKTHIINYVKTKDVYADYRKCGYRKKLLEEHRQEILLHKAAKKAFDELGVKKLPKVKELNAEYTEILAEKKKLYAEYREAKKEMQEIQRAKYDIDQFLKHDDEQKKEREKTQY